MDLILFQTYENANIGYRWSAMMAKNFTFKNREKRGESNKLMETGNRTEWERYNGVMPIIGDNNKTHNFWSNKFCCMMP